jgi:hypothetical protein
LNQQRTRNGTSDLAAEHPRHGHAGVDLASITGEFEREGVEAFCDSYRRLLDCTETKLGAVTAA